MKSAALFAALVASANAKQWKAGQHQLSRDVQESCKLTVQALQKASKDYEAMEQLDQQQRRGAAFSSSCDSWALAWYAQGNWETNYVPDQLLDGVKLRSKSQKECKCQKKGDPSSCNCGDEPLEDCTIAVVRGMRHDEGQKTMLPWLDARFASKKLRRAYVMIGEEGKGCGDLSEFYKSAPLVLRNYYSEDCGGFQSVVTVPLGRTKGHEKVPDSKPLSQRRLNWSFSSDHYLPAREALARQFVERFPADSHLLYPGQDAKYMETLCDSKFALAPRGGEVEDTWRLDEALSCGTIPVVTDGGKYFSRYMPKDLVSSFVTVDDSLSNATFDKVGAEVDALLRDPAALDKRGKQVAEAWASYQKSLKTSISDRLQKVTAPV